MFRDGYPSHTDADTMSVADSLLPEFDQEMAATRRLLERVPGVLLTAPRGTMVRSHIGHLSHHRGQLTVYLRLLDVPIPSIYGPTADERSF